MNKEPISLYIFRFILGLGLFAFMAMLYWSSVLIEQDVLSLRSDLAQLKNELFNMHADTERIRDDILKTLLENRPIPTETSSHNNNAIKNTNPSSKQDNSFPNLLTIDPFYTTILPKMIGSNFKPSGTRREASVGKPDNLHPFSNWSHVVAWVEQCKVSISTQHFGKYETFGPDMALKMELRKDEKGNPEYWLHLRHDVFWQPLQQEHFSKGITLAPQFLRKHQVTAHDFKFYFDAIMNPHIDQAQAVALRLYYNDIIGMEVVDDFTLVVRWKTENLPDADGKLTPQMKYMAKSWTASLRPLASFVYKYFPDGTKIVSDDSDPNTYRTNPIWAQNFAQHWAQNIIPSCGAWIFDGMTDREIRFKRNPDYYVSNAVLVEGYEIKFKDSPDSIWEEFKSGSIDLFQIPPNQLAELGRFLKSAPYQQQEKAGLAIKRLDFIDRSYNYVGWNEANPLFKNKKVRQALTMAIDRKRIIEQNLNGMGVETTGTFFRYSPSYDESIVPYPYDPQLAKSMLAEEGWYDSQGDGLIDKEINGKRVPFQFKLTYYVKNPTTKSICEYIETALKEIDVDCTMNGVDVADLSAVFDNKSFDAVFLGWALGAPPEDPKQLWYSAGSSDKGSSNAISFSNKEIDSIINQLEYEFDPAKRIELYHRFDKILYEEAPYTFLYTPKAVFIYRDYLQNVFIPAQKQDLIPGANVGEPQSSIFWIKK